MAVSESAYLGLTVDALVKQLDQVSSVEQSSRSWPAERAAFALAGAGVRSAETALRRYATMRSVDGSWRATRWSEIPALLSLPLPERISALWSRFPFEPHILAMVDPTATEMREVLAILIGHIEQEQRQVPTGSSCLISCAAMAAQRGVALPPLQSDWWLERYVWGQVESPVVDLAGRPLTSIAAPGASPALVRDSILTTAYSRGALREDLIAIEGAGYRDIGRGWALLADIDGFKDFNDNYGLRSGDIVLAQLADRLQRHFGDCLLRYSGEQFIVFWQGEGGLEVAEEMRAAVEREPFVLPEYEDLLAITISVGAARFQEVGEGIESALEALVSAKEAGRNCVRGINTK